MYDDTRILWGISDFKLQYEQCFIQYCGDKSWEYSHRYFFDLGLNYNKIVFDNNYFSYNLLLQPNYGQKVQLFLIIQKDIQRDFNFQIRTVNNNIVWNQNFRQFNTKVERRYQIVPIEFVINSNSHNLQIVFLSDAQQDIGISDLLVYIRACQVDQCLVCTNSLPKCQKCKFGYKLVQNREDQCIPQFSYQDLQFELVHQSFINNNILDPQELWKVENRGPLLKNTLYTQDGLLIFGGDRIFTPQTVLTYKGGLFTQYQNKHHFYAEIYLNVSKNIQNLPQIKIHRKIQKNNKEYFYNHQWDCDFDDKDSDIIFSNNDYIEKLCYVEFDLEHDKYKQYQLVINNRQQSGIDFSWGIRNIRILAELNGNGCALVYTQANYLGKEFKICDKIENLEHQHISANIKSLKVPLGGKLTLFSKDRYQGKVYVFNQDTPIIDEDVVLQHSDYRNNEQEL